MTGKGNGTKPRKMGRPTLAPAKRLGEFVKFRVRPAERRALDQKAKDAGLSLSDYLREKGLAS